MSFESDLLIDRRRLKRRLLFWRALAVLAVLVVLLLGVGVAGRTAGFGGPLGGAYVARLDVGGLIGENHDLDEAVAKLASDSRARALLIRVDSPGGTVSGGESLHDAIAKVAAKKPVVVVMGGTAASAAYMISAPASRIFAHDSTLTGSIGVLLETGEVSGLLDKLGIRAETIVSGPLKNQPSLTAPISPAGQEVLQALVMDMYDQFVAIVASGRHMDPARVRELADGRAYTGRQALALGLVDAIGGEDEARAWLASAKGVPAGLPTRKVTTETGAMSRVFGALGPPWGSLLKSVFGQGVILDGAWAVWQPGLHGG